MNKIAEIFQGILTFFIISLSTLFLALPIYLAIALIVILPFEKPRRFLKKSIFELAKCWVSFNAFLFNRRKNLQLNLSIDGELSLNEWYLLIANHQSMADILILQCALNKRAPFLKFLIKKELIYVPLFGLIWWALDYPLLRREAKKSGRDFKTTQKACEKFRISPVTVVNFVEGTRYSEEKRIEAQTPYKHLLTPRPGTSAIILSELQDIIHAILDVTIKYDNKTTIWSLICGKKQRIQVHVAVIPLSDLALKEPIMQDKKALAQYRHFIQDAWEKKDRLLAKEHLDDN